MWKVLGKDASTCPLPEVPDWFWQHIPEAFAHYENGYLLYEGGILDQPTWYYATMARVAGLLRGSRGGDSG